MRCRGGSPRTGAPSWTPCAGRSRRAAAPSRRRAPSAPCSSGRPSPCSSGSARGGPVQRPARPSRAPREARRWVRRAPPWPRARHRGEAVTAPRRRARPATPLGPRRWTRPGSLRGPSSCVPRSSACAARPATRASCSPACPAAPSSWRRGATGSSSLCRPSVPGASLAPPLCPWPPAAFSCWSRRQPPRSGGAPAAGAGPAGPRRRGRRRLALRRCWLRTRRRASWRWRPRCRPRTPSSAPCARSWRASARAWVLRRPCSRAWPSPATVVPQLLRRTRWRRTGGPSRSSSVVDGTQTSRSCLGPLWRVRGHL
ncbi:unnamed protein product [Prorocentrum cordatum]|uniref:Uncharacterized protein n=1 Tax=Prorocentrum cordatum TaxID=2364126 RepID=A0ABN9QM42_9DINO|nr:unnamed protein product [Polarella glacialis]